MIYALFVIGLRSIKGLHSWVEVEENLDIAYDR